MGYIFKHENSEKEIAWIAINESELCIPMEHDGKGMCFYANTRTGLNQYMKAYNQHADARSLTHCTSADIKTRKIETKGWRFYAEYESKTLRDKDVAHTRKDDVEVLQYTTGNVVAVWAEANYGIYDGISSVPAFPSPNESALTTTSISREYLQEQCKSVSLRQAIHLHPNMFLSGYFDSIPA